VAQGAEAHRRDEAVTGDTRHTPQQTEWRKKPVVIRAVQITEDFAWKVIADHSALPKGVRFSGAGYHEGNRTIDHFVVAVETLEGTMRGGIGDWIITGVKGEMYFCKPDIFEATYEPAHTPSEKVDGVALAKAVQAYDLAIQSCGNDPEMMASFCTAQGDNLDKLYFDMVNAANAINEPEAQRGG
jgi:hypothetical protein